MIYDAEHFFDGWKANPEYAAEDDPRRGRGGRHADRHVRHQRRHAARGSRRARPRKRPPAVDVPLGIHCHNDCDLAVANSLAAVDAGAVHVQGTINGLGERCGNADLISVIGNLRSRSKALRSARQAATTLLEHLTELSRYVYEIANMNFRTNQPFVGASAFAHKGGMHVHAVAKAAHSYEHIDPAAVGNERRVLVSELSGRSNIIALATKHNLAARPRADGPRSAADRRAGKPGYQFEAAEASFDLLVKRLAGHVHAALRAAEVPRERREPRRRRRSPKRRVKLRSATQSATKWPKATAR